MENRFTDSFRHKGLRKKLIEGLRGKGISDERILEAINRVPRHCFMESGFIDFAYKDQAFPIAAGQTISQPYTVAFQTLLLDIKPGDKVLEIGTGSGYQAAILLELKAKVYTVERIKELHRKAKELLKKLGYNPFFYFGDGYEGLPTYGPFDKILITAGASDIPEKLKFQLKVCGRMVVPVGNEQGQFMLTIDRISEEKFEIKNHGEFVFVPMLKGTIKE